MARPAVSSFVRKAKSADIPPIPGTRASLQNALLLISSGIPSFDAVIGGGLPVGSLILVDEDSCATFGKLFVKYFLAEGIASGQPVHFCSKDVDGESFVKQLPKPVEREGSDDGETNETDNDKLTIAWRYQNLKTVGALNTITQHFGHYFDLSKSMDADLIKNSDVSVWTSKEACKNESFERSCYGSLLESVRTVLENGKYFASDSKTKREILRLALFQVGSPLWPRTEQHLPTFLYYLRSLLRNSFSTCMISVPFHLYENEDFKSKCVHLSDVCVQLESFSGTELEDNPALRDYSGFFRIRKWAAVNGLVTGGSQTLDLALKLRRRKLSIEKLHLPPELEDDAGKTEESSVGCGGPRQRLLEF